FGNTLMRPYLMLFPNPLTYSQIPPANKFRPRTVAYSLRQLHQYQKLIHSLHRAYLLDNTFLNHSKTDAPIRQYKKDANPRLAPKFCVTGFIFEVVSYQGVN